MTHDHIHKLQKNQVPYLQKMKETFGM